MCGNTVSRIGVDPKIAFAIRHRIIVFALRPGRWHLRNEKSIRLCHVCVQSMCTSYSHRHTKFSSGPVAILSCSSLIILRPFGLNAIPISMSMQWNFVKMRDFMNAMDKTDNSIKLNVEDYADALHCHWTQHQRRQQRWLLQRWEASSRCLSLCLWLNVWCFDGLQRKITSSIRHIPLYYFA